MCISLYMCLSHVCIHICIFLSHVITIYIYIYAIGCYILLDRDTFPYIYEIDKIVWFFFEWSYTKILYTIFLLLWFSYKYMYRIKTYRYACSIKITLIYELGLIERKKISINYDNVMITSWRGLNIKVFFFYIVYTFICIE